MASYDVFVAFSEADKELANEQVVLPLRSADLKVVTRSDGKYGATILDNLEESVRESVHTLAVITSNYLNDPICDLLEDLAMHLDPAAREAKFIPLFFEPLERLKQNAGGQSLLLLSRLMGVDLTAIGDRVSKFSNLLAQICGDRKLATQGNVRSVQQGVATLQWFLGLPGARTRIEMFATIFEQACGEITLLSHDKNLHEDFHMAQQSLKVVISRKRELIEKLSLSHPDDGAVEIAWEMLGNSFAELQPHLDTAKGHAREYSTGGGCPPWIAGMDAAETDVVEGLQEKDLDKVKVGIEGITNVLRHEPTRLNGALKEKAKQLPFGELIALQTEILKQLSPDDFNDEAREHIEVSSAGIKALELIKENLDCLISNHDALQCCDDYLQVLDHMFPLELLRVSQAWRGIAAPLRELKPARWMDDLKLADKLKSLEAAMQDYPRASSDPEVARRIRSEYSKLRPAVEKGFSRTDWDLKTDCGELVNKLPQALTSSPGYANHLRSSAPRRTGPANDR